MDAMFFAACMVSQLGCHSSRSMPVGAHINDRNNSVQAKYLLS
jgi:hypothetical protein